MSAPSHSTSAVLDSAEAAESEPSPALRVAIVREDADWTAFPTAENAIHAAAAALAAHPRCMLPDGAEAGVVLADNDMMRRLNATYRGKDAPTNVLTFPFQAPAGAGTEDRGYLGDVVLAAETVLGEAQERGIAPSAHLQHLVVHGLLHLLGFDHASDAEADDMESLETQILATLGIADPYAEFAA